MGINKKLSIGVLTVVSFIGFPLTAFSADKDQSVSVTKKNAQLYSMEVAKKTLPKFHVVDGQVESVQKATVSAQTSGTIEMLFYDVDDFVEKDKVIARIRAQNQKAALQQAKAGLEQAKANISEARARYNESVAEFNRIEKVYERQLISRAKYDNARASMDAAAARLEAVKAALASSKAVVSQAGEQLGYTEVRAPYSGIVTSRLVEIGEVVNAGTPIMSGISLDQLRVSFTLSQSQVAKAREISGAKVILNGETIPVKKLTFFPYADPATNAFRVRADLGEGSEALYPGMFVKVAVAVGESSKLTVPQSAIAYRSEVTGLYVIDDAGVPRLRQVRLGLKSEDGKIQILSGLEDKETIALNPTQAAVYYKQWVSQSLSDKAKDDHHE